MTEYPSGTVAFLFTDIEGSTKRWETNRQAMEAAVECHLALLREAIAAQDGVLFKTIGDAIQAAFPTVPKAIAAAIEAQIALRRADWGELGPLRVRMAIHAGEATPRDGDYLAPALNRLSRVLVTGYGEQILLTDTARTLATALPVGYALQDEDSAGAAVEAERDFGSPWSVGNAARSIAGLTASSQLVDCSVIASDVSRNPVPDDDFRCDLSP